MDSFVGDYYRNLSPLSGSITGCQMMSHFQSRDGAIQQLLISFVYAIYRNRGQKKKGVVGTFRNPFPFVHLIDLS